MYIIYVEGKKKRKKYKFDIEKVIILLIYLFTDVYRMEKEDLMRISMALAKFRPSFLSLIHSLTEDDLIFMEKCIQRTLLVINKYVIYK